MTISHIISSIDISRGGPSRSSTHLLSEMGSQFPKVNFHLHTYDSAEPIIKSFNQDNVSLNFYDLKSLGRLDGLEKSLLQSDTSIFHAHGIWELPMHQMAKLARKLKTPYVITPRGMLESWSLKQRSLKKKIALKLYQYADLANASCIHVTAQMEADSVRALGLKNPIAIIPNGVPLDDFPFNNNDVYIPSKKILFLSRIHLKKGLEMLIQAWAKIDPNLRNGWSIDIVGDGDQNYINLLKTLINKNGVEKDIFFKGPLYGDEKVKAYQNADFFILPTHSENYGIVIAEALASGTPAITTKGAPWEDLEKFNCGWWTNVDAEALKIALEEALVLPNSKVRSMGAKGRQLIEQKYSMTAVGAMMDELYQWLLGEAVKPAFIV